MKAFTMPKWGIEMSEGTIGGWSVEEGKPFAKGDVIVLIETDKITNEVEAEADGTLVRIVARHGETLPVGALLAVYGKDEPAAEADAFVAAFRPADARMAASDTEDMIAEAAAETAVPPLAVPTPVAIDERVAISPAARARATLARLDVAVLEGTGRGGRIMLQDVEQALRPATDLSLKGPYETTPPGMAFASPMARRLAARHGVDLSGLKGTGPRGRICKEDVLAASGPGTAPPGKVEVIAMSPMRKAIARRLTEAKQTIPHFYLRRRVRADRLLAAREEAGKVASINDYLVRAAALALRQVPTINIQVHGNDIHRFPSADISLAVATDKGLLTPVLRGADSLSLETIATRTRDLATRARASKLKQGEIEGGSFSISNLGPYGIEQFDAIINPPQGAILAVGAARPEPVEDGGAIRIVPVIHLSLSCDHRAIDGADGARFLAILAELIEHPEGL